jgi:hypothetical protein
MTKGGKSKGRRRALTHTNLMKMRNRRVIKN